MTRYVTVLLGALLVVGTVSSAVVVSPQQPVFDSLSKPPVDDSVVHSPAHGPASGQSVSVRRPRERQMDDEGNGSAPSGGFISSVVGMEEATVDATVTVASFETRLSAAATDSERAAVIARSLNASRMQVSMLESRLEALRARRMNGSISRGWFAVETSWLLSSAEEQRAVTARLERATRTVPQDELARRNAAAAQIQRLQDRIDRLLATEVPEIHRTSFDRQFYRDLAVVVERFNESAESTNLGVLRPLFDREQVNVYIDGTDRSPSVVSFRTTDQPRITDLRAGERANATVRMRMDERTARRLVNAERPGRVFARAFLNDEISVRGIGLLNRLKWSVRSIVFAITRLLADGGGLMMHAV